jgi:hypothetical protein
LKFSERNARSSFSVCGETSACALEESGFMEHSI